MITRTKARIPESVLFLFKSSLYQEAANLYYTLMLSLALPVGACLHKTLQYSLRPPEQYLEGEGWPMINISRASLWQVSSIKQSYHTILHVVTHIVFSLSLSLSLYTFLSSHLFYSPSSICDEEMDLLILVSLEPNQIFGWVIVTSRELLAMNMSSCSRGREEDRNWLDSFYSHQTTSSCSLIPLSS